MDGSRTVIAMKTTTSVMMIAAALGRAREELLRLIDANKRGFIIKIITGSHTPNDIRTGRLIVASCPVGMSIGIMVAHGTPLETIEGCT